MFGLVMHMDKTGYCRIPLFLWLLLGFWRTTMESTQEILANITGITSSSGKYAFEMTYRAARDLEAAENRGDTRKLKELDFAVPPQCVRCHLPCVDYGKQAWRPLKCGRCMAVIYCSKECQTVDWKKGEDSSAPHHKRFCSRNVEHMKRLPYFQNMPKQFPWFRMEGDGTCDHNILKARLRVLGSGLSFGYWSISGGKATQDSSRILRTEDIHAANPFKNDAEIPPPRTIEYVHGAMLLEKEWPEDLVAWNLEERLVPRLKFDNQKWPAPKRPEPGEVKDWASWYKWRGISLESPAALLMDGPLSVYHLLANVLKVVGVKEDSDARQELRVHLLGAAIELNFLPLLSEVALLLPKTDIEITLFGKSVFDLVAKARRDHPDSLATRDTVWSYNAPESTGSGSMTIKLHAETEFWTRRVLRTEMGPPNAMVALNSGLILDASWGDPIIYSALFAVPFAITEYTEQTLEEIVAALPDVWTKAGAHFQTITKGRSPRDLTTLGKGMMHPISPNPFHRPGQRPLPFAYLPTAYNGFTVPVVLKDKSQDSTNISTIA